MAQERLNKLKVRQGLREILMEEVQFYHNCCDSISKVASYFAGFCYSALLLDPYDTRNDLAPRNLSSRQQKRVTRLWNACISVTVCFSFCVLLYAKYLGIFSSRMALRGGPSAVETVVKKMRGEIKMLLFSLTGMIFTAANQRCSQNGALLVCKHRFFFPSALSYVHAHCCYCCSPRERRVLHNCDCCSRVPQDGENGERSHLHDKFLCFLCRAVPDQAGH